MHSDSTGKPQKMAGVALACVVACVLAAGVCVAQDADVGGADLRDRAAMLRCSAIAAPDYSHGHYPTVVYNR